MSKSLAGGADTIGSLISLEAVMSSRPVKQYNKFRWSDELPMLVSMTFVAVFMASDLAGDEMWKKIEKFVGSIKKAQVGAMEREMAKEIEDRYLARYGPYEKTVPAMVDILVKHGLVTKGNKDGQEVLSIPEFLPLSGTFITDARAYHADSNVMKAQHRGKGPRYRVYMEDLPEVQRMLERGWSRHLPAELGLMFSIVAAVNKGGCIGDLMWLNIHDLYQQAIRQDPPFMPPDVQLELAERFAEEYGRPYDFSMRGAVQALRELGLVKQCEKDGKDALIIPDTLPWPDESLLLSAKEKEILAVRRKH